MVMIVVLRAGAGIHQLPGDDASRKGLDAAAGSDRGVAARHPTERAPWTPFGLTSTVVVSPKTPAEDGPEGPRFPPLEGGVLQEAFWRTPPSSGFIPARRIMRSPLGIA